MESSVKRILCSIGDYMNRQATKTLANGRIGDGGESVGFLVEHPGDIHGEPSFKLRKGTGRDWNGTISNEKPLLIVACNPISNCLE